MRTSCGDYLADIALHNHRTTSSAHMHINVPALVQVDWQRYKRDTTAKDRQETGTQHMSRNKVVLACMIIQPPATVQMEQRWENRVTFSREVTDLFGLPQPTFDFRYDEKTKHTVVRLS